MGSKCHYTFTAGTNFHDGLLTVCKQNIIMDHETKSQQQVPSGGAWHAITVEHDKIKYDLINVYAPRKPDARKKFMLTIPDLPNKTIMGGDFNVTLNSSERENYVNQTADRPGAMELVTKTVELGVTDAFKLLNNQFAFTWTSADGKKKGLLDRIYVDDSLSTRVKQSKHYDLGVKTLDHLAVITDLSTRKVTRGADRWFANTAHYETDTFTDDLNVLVKSKHYQIMHGPDPNESYTQLHDEMQRMHVKHGLHVAAQARLAEKNILAHIQRIRREPVREPNGSNRNQTKEQRLDKYYKQLDILNNYRMNAARLRANANRITAGQPTKAFYAINAGRAHAAELVSVKCSLTGNILTASKDILSEATRFWKKLYQPTDNEIPQDADMDKLLDYLEVKLTDDQKVHLNRILTKLELTEALKNLSDKSPGSTGFKKHLYEITWEAGMGEYLLRVI